MIYRFRICRSVIRRLATCLCLAALFSGAVTSDVVAKKEKDTGPIIQQGDADGINGIRGPKFLEVEDDVPDPAGPNVRYAPRRANTVIMLWLKHTIVFRLL